MKSPDEVETSRNGLDEDEINASIEALARSGRRRARLARIIIVLVAIPLLVGFALFMVDVAYPEVGKYARGVLSGEKDFVGQNKYTPAHPMSAAQFQDAIDMAQVHGDLMTAWLVSKSREQPGETSERTLKHFETLRDAVSGDPNLSKIVAELGELVHSGVSEENFDRLSYMVWSWNEYLRQQSQPYYFETTVLTGREEPMVYVKNYSVVTELPFSLTVGEAKTEADRRVNGLITRRSDRTNVVENYLCRATSATQRPLWIVDTAQRDGAEYIWPILAEANDPTLAAAQRGFAPAIRRQAEEMLSPAAIDTLTRTAPARHQLLQTVAAINERACQDFYISDIPQITYSLAELERLARFASDAACPRIRLDEVHALADSAKILIPETHALEGALAELAAWTIRPHLVHEVRHYFDATRPFAPLRPLRCPGCKTPMGIAQNVELHAYLAAIAYSDAPVMGAYLACRVASTSQTSHKFALAPLIQKLIKNENCADGPIADASADALQAAAIQAERELFGHAESIQAQAAWPRSLASYADQ